MKNQSTKRHDFQGKNNLKVAIYCRFASENQEVDPTEKIEKANEFFKNETHRVTLYPNGSTDMVGCKFTELIQTR